MKKFKFKLESVLKYKGRIEENEKMVLRNMHNELNNMIAELNKFKEDYKDEKENFECKTRMGMTIQKALECKIIIKSIENKIEYKTAEIASQNKKIQRQTQVVVIATQERKILEKLKEKKYKLYVDASVKAEEKIIEELASNRIAAGK